MTSPTMPDRPMQTLVRWRKWPEEWPIEELHPEDYATLVLLEDRTVTIAHFDAGCNPTHEDPGEPSGWFNEDFSDMLKVTHFALPSDIHHGEFVSVGAVKALPSFQFVTGQKTDGWDSRRWVRLSDIEQLGKGG